MGTQLDACYGWSRSPLVRLMALGGLSWLAYLHLTISYPLPEIVAKFPLTDFGRVNNYSQPALVDFLLSVFVPFSLYLIAWRVVSCNALDRRARWVIFGFAVLFAATLLAMYPIGATDLFDYVFYSRIFVRYHQNPLIVAPIHFPDDPFLRTVIWYRSPSPYGPLWILLTVPGSLLAGDDLTLNLILMNALPALSFLASAMIISQILKHYDPDQRTTGTLLFAWNPLLLFEAVGNGHNGIIMMLFVLLAIYFLVQKRWIWVLPALVVSVLVKYISAILLLPFLIYCLRAQNGLVNRLRFLALTIAISTTLFAIVVSPFFQIPYGLLDEANWYSLLAIPTLAFHSLKPTLGEKDARTWTLTLTSAAYLFLYALSFRYIFKSHEPRRLFLLSTWLTISYLAVACVYFQPWFIIWQIALGIWLNHTLVRRVILTFTATGLLSYAANFFWIWNWERWQRIQVNAWFVAVIFGPPLVVGVLSLVRDTWARFQSRVSSVAGEPA